LSRSHRSGPSSSIVARIVLAAALLLHAAGTARGEDWPQWRGPRGDGTSLERGLPLEWSRSRNVVWRLPLPGPAGATPVVWKDRIFLTSADGSEVALLAVSTGGKELWRRKLSSGNRQVRGDEGNSASPSPSTDGENVWSFTGKGDLACHDLEGREVWKVNLEERHGRFQIQFGMTSTPLLFGDTLYLQCIQTREPYLLAIDKKTGQDRWKRPRPTDARAECEHSYASPMLYRDEKLTLLLVQGGDYLTAHTLEDGSEVWRCGGLNPKENYNTTLRFIASPVSEPGLVVIPSAKNGPVVAVRPDGSGDITETKVVWKRASNTPDVPTPAIHDGLLYLLRENGVLICLEAATGKELYQERTHVQNHRASPLVADGKVYCAATDGTVTVVQAGRAFKSLAENNVDEHIASTPVAAGGRLYLRSYAALYAIQAPDAAPVSGPLPEDAGARKAAAADPAQAGEDFAIQGEYLSELPHQGSSARFGIQVIALGRHRFRAVSHLGGLPGEGWDKKTRLADEGELKDGAVSFAGPLKGAVIRGGVLSVPDPKGGPPRQAARLERKSPTLGKRPPEGAVVLFDGTSAARFEGGRMTLDGLLMEGARSKQKFQSCTLHVEFRTPFLPEARGQERGNSGAYLQGRYEVQILDSFGLEGKMDECGGIYSVHAPEVNLCFPPLSWQTYDVEFTAARFGPDGKKVKNAVMTVLHNGVLVHQEVEVDHATTAAPLKEGPEPGPLYLQDHGSPVRFRNIWLLVKAS
jgi:outer membrane protein assembly factor BamB